MISTDKVFRLLLDWSPLAFVANPAADETVNFAACPAAASWITSVQVAMLIRVFCIRANFRRFKLQRRRQHDAEGLSGKRNVWYEGQRSRVGHLVLQLNCCRAGPQRKVEITAALIRKCHCDELHSVLLRPLSYGRKHRSFRRKGEPEKLLLLYCSRRIGAVDQGQQLGNP